MWCPIHHWHHVFANGKGETGKTRRRLRRMFPGLLRSLAAMSFLGHGVVLYAEYAPDGMGSEPPPGHPERLVPPGSPATATERELWAALEGIDWW